MAKKYPWPSSNVVRHKEIYHWGSTPSPLAVDVGTVASGEPVHSPVTVSKVGNIGYYYSPSHNPNLKVANIS